MKNNVGLKTEVVDSQKIYSTMNYKQFKHMPGNREVDQQHVKQLVMRISEVNLNTSFPIIVNEKFEVIDGQHRLEALKILSLPVYYIMKENLNIDNVVMVNSTMRNWSWKDYARTYAERGNEHYKQFLQLVEDYALPYTVLLSFAGGASASISNGRFKSGRGTLHIGGSTQFNEGRFEMSNYELTRKLLDQYLEVAEIANIPSRNFANAMYAFMRAPGYDHAYMISQIRSYKNTLADCYLTSDFLEELETIYQTHDFTPSN